MPLYYYVNEGIPVTTQGDLFFYVDALAQKSLLHESGATYLTYKGADFLAQLTLYRKAKVDKATTTIKIIDKKMRYMHKVNANDFEKEINATDNPGLAELFGYVLTNTNKNVVKVPIEVLNDVTIGIILYIFLAVDGAHSYNLECTLVGENGKDDVVVVRNTTFASGSLDGFISGAKYRFRVQGVLGNAVFSEFTGYVELRIN